LGDASTPHLGRFPLPGPRSRHAAEPSARAILRSSVGYASFRASFFSNFPDSRNKMSKGDLLEMEGVIQDALGGGQYTIKVDQGGAMVRAQLSGRMRRHHIRVLPGDKVRVAVSPYDLSHGLIVYRGRS